MRDSIFTLNNPFAPRLCPELAQEIGLNESIILLQIEFWIRTSTTAEHEGRRWTYQSVRAMQEAFPFWSIATINRAIQELVARGYVLVGNYNQAKYDKTRWFALNPDALRRLKSIVIAPADGGDDTRSAQNDTRSAQNETTIPENTTENLSGTGTAAQPQNFSPSVEPAPTAHESSEPASREPEPAKPTRPAPAPNIFRLYENEIGLLTPMIADSLKDAEQDYPADWIADAIRIAGAQNKRSWAYCEAILKRWKVEGRGDSKEKRAPPNGQRANAPPAPRRNGQTSVMDVMREGFALLEQIRNGES